MSKTGFSNDKVSRLAFSSFVRRPKYRQQIIRLSNREAVIGD
jgi:hypothetical protein